jgi:uncharacterized membrane protein YfcA
VIGLRGLLLLALGGTAAAFTAWAGWNARRRRRAGDPAWDVGRPRAVEVGVGFLTDFFDTLGIGSFAPTTALFRLLRLVPDRLIPGTLNVGHALPTVAQAFIYITVIEVETVTLVLLIGASALGAWIGAGVVARWPRRAIQRGMGIALLAAAGVMVLGLLHLVPAGGDKLGLAGWRLGVGLAGNFGLGALMTIGIGAYAPSLILFGLLGMNVKSIFPVMMGSCAFIMPASGVEFVRHGSYAFRPALGLALGGVPAVLLAAFVVRELPLGVVRWLVVAVVVYTALAMLRSAARDKDTANQDGS